MSVIERRERMHFATFRLLFGGYLCVFFLRLVPYGPELYSREGMLADPALNPTHRLLPDLLGGLGRLDDPVTIQILLAGAALGSIPLALGRGRRLAATGIWLVFLALYLRNNFTRHVAIDYIGWMLLACAAVPRGEGRLPWRSQDASSRPDWKMPRELFVGAWAIASLGYSLSGWLKLGNPLWRDGSALSFVLTGPLARDWLPTRLLAELPAVPELLTWLFVFAELLFLPMALWRRTRPVAWTLMFAMHVGIASFLNIGEIPVAMLIFHVLLFDVRWLPRGRASASG